MARMREVLRGSALHHFGSGRYQLYIKLNVALSILNGSALVDASREVAPLNALPLDQKDADTEAAVATIHEPVRAIYVHRSSLWMGVVSQNIRCVGLHFSA